MACRGCSSDGCNCSVVGDGVGIDVTGSGTPITSPYLVSFNIEEALADVDEDNVTACDTLNDPHVPVLLGDGSVKMVPLPCGNDGPLPGQAFGFTFSTNTANTDPGDATVKFNNASYPAVGYIYVDTQEVNGTDITAWLDGLDNIVSTPKGMVRVYSRSDHDIWASFRLNYVNSATGYRELEVTYLDHSGAFQSGVVGDTVLDFTTASEGSVGGFDSIQNITTVAGTFTIAVADVGYYLRCGNASPFTVTVPLNATAAVPIGAHIDLIQTLAGQVTIAGAVGVTVNASPGLKLNGQWAAATLIKVGTDEWDLIGNLTS